MDTLIVIEMVICILDIKLKIVKWLEDKARSTSEELSSVQ